MWSTCAIAGLVALHKGDTMSANMLVRNIGELDGRAWLVLNIDGIVSEGDWVELEQRFLLANFRFQHKRFPRVQPMSTGPLKAMTGWSWERTLG